MKNRYTIQILGNFDTDDKFSIQGKIFKALDTIEGLTVKAISTDLWTDYNGTVRKWDDEGREVTDGYVMTPVQPTQVVTPETSETVEKTEDLEIEEVTDTTSK